MGDLRAVPEEDSTGSFSPLVRKLGRIPSVVPLLGAMLVFCLLSIVPILEESATVDEFVHLPSGYTYLDRRDYRLNPEHPPLAKVWAALPLFFQEPRCPEGSAWDRADQAEFGFRFLYQSGNRPDLLLRSARTMALFWGLLVLGTVYALARELYGPGKALISLGVATFCPPLLAHAHLVTMDAALSALLLLCAASFRMLLAGPGPKTSLYLGILLGGALCTKFVSVIVIPAMLWMGVLAWMEMRRRALRPDFGRVAACGATVAATALLVIWALYGFRFEASPGGNPGAEIPSSSATSLSEKIILGALEHRVLPESFLKGFLFQMHHSSDGHTAYAFGLHGQRGWWWFFPAVFLVKTPVSSIVLMVWGSLRAGGRFLSGNLGESVVLVPLVCYGVLALAGSINLGVRLILPLYPLLAVLAAGVSFPRVGRIPDFAVPAGLVALSAAGTLVAAPYFLSYFNLPSLLFRERHEMLVDSDLDWGQDLGRLERYAADRGIPVLKLAYFGSGSPRSLHLRHERLPGDNFYRLYEPEWAESRQLEPGDWLAVSATHRVGFLPGPTRGYYEPLLRGWTPVTTLGHSIFVYQVPSDSEDGRARR